MKLLSIVLARSIWICHMHDMNPHGRYLIKEVLPFVLEKYKFKKYPTIETPISEVKEIKFEDGEFINKNEEVINIRLSLYDYGFVAETRSSTNDTDDFMDSLLTDLHLNFNLPHYNDFITKKQYLSQFYVSTNKSLSVINPALEVISKYLSENVVGYANTDYQFSGLSYMPDQNNGVNAPAFSIERVVTVPFSENRYLTTSGLQTNKHLELLQMLEDILK